MTFVAPPLPETNWVRLRLSLWELGPSILCLVINTKEIEDVLLIQLSFSFQGPSPCWRLSLTLPISLCLSLLDDPFDLLAWRKWIMYWDLILSWASTKEEEHRISFTCSIHSQKAKNWVRGWTGEKKRWACENTETDAGKSENWMRTREKVWFWRGGEGCEVSKSFWSEVSWLKRYLPPSARVYVPRFSKQIFDKVSYPL